MQKLPKIKTQDEAEAALGAYSLASNRLAKVAAEMNLKLTDVRQRYEAEMTELAETMKAEEKRLHAWADENPEAFGKSRSLRLLHGVLGYRTGNWAVRLLRGTTAARAIALVKQVIGPGYVRTREELDKEAIIADRARYDARTLAKCGLAIEQGEKFYIEPEKTEAPE
jgi:phage host-nuclease inhibitor protein Gam